MKRCRCGHGLDDHYMPDGGMEPCKECDECETFETDKDYWDRVRPDAV